MQITFIGDIFPSNESFSLGFGIKSKFEKHQGQDWIDNIISITKHSDIVVGNLESPLIESSMAVKQDFYGVPSFATFLQECGVNVLNVANNHILEHGKAGYEETLKTLDEANISIVGDKNKVLYLCWDNSKIAIAGFCGVDLNLFENNNCFSELNKQNIELCLDDMGKNNADLKIFCFHWGNEYIHKPSMEQRLLAYKLIDAGVDIIIGHHPHVIQPYEKYKNGHIFYSLGNFCFDNPFQSRQFSKGMGVTIKFDTINNEILAIEPFGVKLLHNMLVRRMTHLEFNSYFKKIQHQYFCKKNDIRYSILYARELSIRHLTERILMKLSLLKLFYKIDSNERKLLIENLKRHYNFK